jgi:hypothetical protein
MLRKPNDFLDSPLGLRIQHTRRIQRRVWIHIDDIEPRAKHSMHDSEKDEVQQRLLDHMQRHRHRAFRGPLALRLMIDTSHKTPSHSHTIAKNLLDLFGKPRATLRTRRRALLYEDDRQIHGLSVTCSHGQPKTDNKGSS